MVGQYLNVQENEISLHLRTLLQPRNRDITNFKDIRLKQRIKICGDDKFIYIYSIQ